MAKDKKKAKPVEEGVELDEDEEEEVDEDETEVEVEEDEDTDEDEAPKKKGKKKSGKGSGRGSGLVPREPVSVPKEIYKAQTPEVQKLLKDREKAQAAGDKAALRKIRSALRKAGFRLSKISEASED